MLSRILGRVKKAIGWDRPELTPEELYVQSVASVTFAGRPDVQVNRLPCECVEQGEVYEFSLKNYETRDWRAYFCSLLKGRGLEIGPLHRPLAKHDGMQVDYVDRMSVADLRKHYPELRELDLVEPNIIGDAETLDTVPDNTYDFLVAAHVIEHMRNPIGAIANWSRVLRPGGFIYMIVPDKRAIFDKQRVRTTVEHLVADYELPSRERDFEHFLEYARFVHGERGSDAVAEARKLEGCDYSIHFHVFLPTDILLLAEWFSKNIAPLTVVDGPSMSPGADEFHVLFRVN